MAFLLSLQGIQRCDSRSRAEVSSALGPRSCTRCQAFPGQGPLKRAVGWSFPRLVHDAGEFTWAPAASVLVVPHASHRLWVPARLRSGWGHQMRLADTA